VFDPFSNPHFERLIEKLEVGMYVVFGVATDYCVKAAAKGLLERGKRTAIVRDAIKPVTTKGGEATCRLLSEIGAEWMDAQRDVLARE
jgi:nicotinamidase/pyrazinamidase